MGRYTAWIVFEDHGEVKKEFPSQETARKWLNEQIEKSSEHWISSGIWPVEPIH